jgi:uncharacterized protein (TIGR02099 family)
MAVSVKSLEGGWDGFRPGFTMNGFTLSDRRGRAALAFERAEVTLSWYALFLGRLRFHKVEFDSPVLALRRGADGLIYLADKPLTAQGADEGGDFSRWLLAQPRLAIHGATLVWRDDKARAPEVRLSNVEIAVRREGRRHRVALTASPPKQLAGRIDLRANVAIERAEHWRVDGELYAEAMHTDIGRLRAHLPVPETLRSGVGSVRVWVALAAEGVRGITADMNLREARAQFSEDALPLELASVSGRAVYRAEPSGFYFGTEGLRFRTATGLDAQPASFSVERRASAGAPPRVAIRGDGVDLKIAAALLDYFPVPRDVKSHVERFAPRGTIARASLTWTGETLSAASAFDVQGEFRDLAVNAVDGLPAVSGLSGRVEGQKGEGRVQIESRGFALELADHFRAPIRLESLAANARWKRVDGNFAVEVEEARFAGVHAEGTARAAWRSLPDSKAGHLELEGSLTRADVRAVGDYLPNRYGATRAYLDGAILAGSSPRATFEVRGDLAHFPFPEGRGGKFLIEGDVTGGRLRYQPDWPTIDAIEGRVRFEGTRMEIHATSGLIFASRVKSASAICADLGAHPAVLDIQGEVQTAGADGIRFLRESPLVKGPGAFSRAIQVEGPATLGLKLHIPLSGQEPMRVAGDYTFAGATASLGRMLTLGGIKGRLSFTEKEVRAPELTGTMFAQPAVLRLASQPDGSVVTTLEGRVASSVLGAYVPEPIAARIEGGLDWRARAVSTAQGTDLVVESDLKGLASTLPAPFGKPAAQARPLAIAIRHLGADDEVATATLAGGIHGRFAARGPAGAQRWQAALKFGAPLASEPERDGIWLYGELPVVELDAWQKVFPARGAARPGAEGPAVRGFDLKLGRVSFTGRDFVDVSARMELAGAEWRGRILGPNLDGEVAWNPEGRGRVHARLARLVIRPMSATAQAPTDSREHGDLPELDVVAERFEFKGNTLGKLELNATYAGEEWRIERLDIGNAHAQFKSTGAWRRTGAGSLTTLDLKLETSNLSALFAQFGYGDYMRRGTATLEGKLAWPGFPYEFELGTLSGAFKLGAARGQFAKIEAGAGKLLGILSLQALPRRVTLDFRDIFSEGFAFERISASVRCARGILLTDDLEISGPAAFVAMAGEVSLPNETQSLALKVVPEVGESVALAATVLGTPVLGLSTLLVSKLLQNPFGKMIAYEYLVTGTWDNPSVTPVSVPPPKAAATAAGAAPQPAAERAPIP